MDRYEQLAHAFVGLADALTSDYHMVELAQQLIDHTMTLLPIAAAGIVLGDEAGKLHVFASSSQESQLLEVQQVQADVGPCLQCYRYGRQVVVEDLTVMPDRWPAFAVRAVEYGFRAVAALPLRLRDERVGALNLFRDVTGPMVRSDVAFGQALADVAAVSILHQRTLAQSAMLNQQLQTALESRVVIEQAKGVLAARGGLDMDRAFARLRAHARNIRRPLAEVARAVVTGDATQSVLESRER